MQRVSIIGFGRFGKTLYRLVKDDFDVTLYDRGDVHLEASELASSTKVTKNLEEVYESNVVFYAVPISEFEPVIAVHQQYFEPHHLLIDVLSVKVHPAKVLKKYLSDTGTQALLTHPMFGPDSSRRGFEGLPIILNQFKSDKDTYRFWKDYFNRKKLIVIEMSPEEHDKLAANSQGLTHFLGRLLD